MYGIWIEMQKKRKSFNVNTSHRIIIVNAFIYEKRKYFINPLLCNVVGRPSSL